MRRGLGAPMRISLSRPLRGRGAGQTSTRLDHQLARPAPTGGLDYDELNRKAAGAGNRGPRA